MNWNWSWKHCTDRSRSNRPADTVPSILCASRRRLILTHGSDLYWSVVCLIDFLDGIQFAAPRCGRQHAQGCDSTGTSAAESGQNRAKVGHQNHAEENLDLHVVCDTFYQSAPVLWHGNNEIESYCFWVLWRRGIFNLRESDTDVFLWIHVQFQQQQRSELQRV